MDKTPKAAPYQEPSINGVPTMNGMKAQHIGWGTTAYGPVEITFCPRWGR